MSNRSLQAATAIESESTAAPSLAARSLAQLVRSGRRDAPRTTTMAALIGYWDCVREMALPERRELCRALRDAIQRGDTGARAWLAVALGEPSDALAQEATRAYVSAAPASIEHRAAAFDDACDAIRRGLGLSPAGIFAGLVAAADAALLERIVALRWRLDARQSAVVFELTAGLRDPAVREFLEDWRATAAD
jgi:hypothetical protein